MSENNKDEKKPEEKAGETGENKAGESSENNLDLGGTEKDNHSDWRKEYKLDKFKTADELAKSYKELEGKLGKMNRLNSKKINELEDAELIEFNKETFKDLSGSKSALEGEFAKQSEELSNELGLPVKFTDVAVGKVSKKLSQKILSQRKGDASQFLEDASKKEAVIAALQMSDDKSYKETFQDRLKLGQVSVEELKLLAKSAGSIEEADLGLRGEKLSDVDLANAEKEYVNLHKGDNYAALNNPQHARHKDVVSRRHQLAKILKV